MYTAETSWIVRPLEPALRGDFLRVHSPQNGASWCRCVAWWVPTWEGWGERTEAANRALRDELFARGQDDGYLLYRASGGAEEPVGWCQCGPRDRLAKLLRQLELAPDPTIWALTCFLVAPSVRRRGAARALLRGVLADLPRRGVRRVQGFPRVRTEEGDAGELWTGPEALFREAGFRRLGEVGPRAVYELELAPGPGEPGPGPPRRDRDRPSA